MSTGLIIFFVIAMALGPLMLMRPSAWQTRIAKLRNTAQGKGMRIRMDTNPFAVKADPVAVYSLLFSKDEDGDAKFSLFRKNYAHDIHFCDEWDWHKEHTFAENRLQALRDFLKTLDGSVVGVECNRSGVGLFWCERMRGIDDEKALQVMLASLQKLRALCHA